MKCFRAVFAMAFLGFASLLLAQGIPVQRTTRLTISEPTEISGTILQPGTYTLKVLDFKTGKITVQVTDAEDRAVLTTVLAQRLRRVLDSDDEVEDQAEFTYTMTNGHPALSSWYYPSDEWGEKFATGLAKWPVEQVGTVTITPIEKTVAAEPAPVQVAENAPEPIPLPKELPKTASDVPLLGLAGLITLAGAGALRLARP
ncbi:MAG: hypothetical protein ACRD16_15890 [Thermoanaerobaculia bacterium]